MYFKATLLTLFIALSSAAVIYIPGVVPTDPMNLYQLQAACNMLQNRLNQDPSLPRYKGFQLYADTYLANYFLQKVANDPGIASYNNIIVGESNTASGNKNLIFGTGNSVTGSNNYVFSQDYDSSQTTNGSQEASHHLVLDDWLVELLKMYMIPFSPQNAIQKWK